MFARSVYTAILQITRELTSKHSITMLTQADVSQQWLLKRLEKRSRQNCTRCRNISQISDLAQGEIVRKYVSEKVTTSDFVTFTQEPGTFTLFEPTQLLR